MKTIDSRLAALETLEARSSGMKCLKVLYVRNDAALTPEQEVEKLRAEQGGQTVMVVSFVSARRETEA